MTPATAAYLGVGGLLRRARGQHVTLASGTPLGHYTITCAIGAGGMGEVYRAHDTRLGRDVAVKVLPAPMAADPDRLERFRREARAVAALSHPHIVMIHSVEEVEGILFLTMELVDGQSLDRLVPPGGLSLDRILSIAGPLADALAAAHEKGIVHRDLKPANVMVTRDGRVKVLDFGLIRIAPAARDLRPADATFTSAGETAAGIVMGTPAYMSPEQVAGRAVDHRSDLFSFGIILCEMASGRRPFEGASSAELASAILRDPPRPLAVIRSDLPADLSRVIGRCLEKDPSLRIQTARDVVNELRLFGASTPAGSPSDRPARHSADSGPAAVARALPVASAAAAPASASAGRPASTAGSISGFGGRPAIAVLPFDNLSRDPEQEYFVDGLAEDLNTRLSLWRSFPAIARNSTFAYKGRGADVKQVATDLGVRDVVLGSVRKAGNRVRVSAQLVDATTGQQVWAQSYDRDLTDVFALQDEISEPIAAPLVGDLHRAEAARTQRQPTEDLQAWELYQRALPLLVTVERDDFVSARQLLERAISIDPHFVAALARLAEVRLWQVLFSWTDDPEDQIDDAGELVRQARALLPALSIAHVRAALGAMAPGVDWRLCDALRSAGVAS